MLKLYNPIFPCNRRLKRSSLNLDGLKDKDIETVKFNEGYGLFTREEWYWIDTKDELEKLKISKVYEPEFFDSFGWYSLTPIELEIEVNRKCNLKCIHCWNESGQDRDVLEKDLIINSIGEFRESGGQRLLITGGEPLLYSNLEEILNFAKEGKIKRLELVTNGTLIDKSIAEMLSNYLIYVNISIHGHNSNVHDTITQSKGSFNKAVNGIINLQEKNVGCVLYFTIMEENFESIPSMFQLAKELGVKAIRFNPVNCVGRAKSQKKMSLEGKIALSKYLQKLSKNIGVDLITSELCRKNYEKDDNYKFYGCNALRTLVYITNRGDVLPCSLLYENVGNIKQEKITKIWKSEKAKIFRENFPSCIDGCINLKNCGGSCRTY